MTHEEYWKNRTDNIFDSNYHKNKLKKLYLKAYAENERQILKLYDELKEKGKLTTTQLYRIDRFMSLRKALAKQAEQVNSELNEQMTQDLTNAYRETFGECVKELGLEMTWSIQNEKMLNKVLNTKWAGSNYSRRIWNNSQQLSKDIEAAVVDCLTRGTSKDFYVKAIKNKYNVGFSKADRLVRTELMHTINEGKRDTYKSEGVKKVKWYAAEDERTCGLCGSMHEKIYDIDDVPSIPHANCRCTFSAVVESLENSGKSAKTVDNSAESGIIDLNGRDEWKNDLIPRGQVTESIAENDLYSWVAKEIKTSEKVATEYVDATMAFTDEYFTPIRKYQRGEKIGEYDPDEIKKLSDDIEIYIKKAPRWNGGETFRGCTVSDDELSLYRSEYVIESMGGTSSWSNTLSVACDFAHNQTTGERPNSVIFHCNKQSKGTGIKHISVFENEDEVLVSKDAKYKVIKTEIYDYTTHVYLEEMI